MPRYVAILGLAVASLFTLTAASATGSGSAVLPVDVASVQRRALLGGDDEEGGAFSSASSGGLEKRRRHRHRKHHSHHKKKKTKKHHHSSKPKPKPKPSHSGNSLSSPSVTHTGDATYFDVGLGACGHYNTNSDMIAAASHQLYDTFPGHTANPNNNPICGRKVRATYKGHSVTVTIVDRCAGCDMWNLDFSPTAFKHFAPLPEGRLHGMTWHWLED